MCERENLFGRLYVRTKLWRPLFGVDKCKLCSFSVAKNYARNIFAE